MSVAPLGHRHVRSSESSGAALTAVIGGSTEPLQERHRRAAESRHYDPWSAVFFSLSSWALALIIFAVIATVTGAGVLLGRRLREHHETLREPFGVLQAAILGIVGLILAFGLTLAVGRYEDRRAAVVSDANAIGTTYLRAQLLAEPVRSRSLVLLHSVHRARPANVARGAGQLADGAHDRRRGRRPAAALEPGRRGDRRCADRVRAAALRGRAEHDDRRADGARLGAQQSSAGPGARARGVRRRGRARSARRSISRCSAAACCRC